MFQPHKIAKTLATLMLISGYVGVSSTTAWSQTANDQNVEEAETPTESAEQPTSENGDADEQPASKGDEESNELDKLLLGPWVLLSKDAAKEPDEESFKAAISRCMEVPKLERFDLEPGADKKLPTPENLIGDVVYYRTDSGIQRFDFKSGRVVLFLQIEKIDAGNNRFIWKLTGNNTGLAFRFADTKNRGGKGQFMLENTRIYLKCGPASSDEPPAEQQ